MRAVWELAILGALGLGFSGCASTQEEVYIPVEEEELEDEGYEYDGESVRTTHSDETFSPEPRARHRWTQDSDDRRFGHWPQASKSLGPKVAAYLAEADRLFDEGDFQGAVREYGQAIKLDARLAYAWCNRGSARRRVGDYEGAIADLTEAIELRPRYALAYNNRGYAKLMRGYDAGMRKKDIQAAIRDFTRAIKIGEDLQRFPSYRNSMALRNRAKAWRCLGLEERARKDDRRARRLEGK